MARIRTIKPEFFEDEALSRLPPHDRLMFIGTWQLADKNGVLEYRPDWIKAKVFPYETGEATDASRVLPRLVLGGFLIHYAVEGREYLQVKNFARHQRINGKEAQSETRYPTSDNELAEVKHTGSTWEAPVKHPESQEGKGREGKGRSSATASPCDNDFEEFWDFYGKKVGKVETSKVWQRMPVPDRQAAVAGVAAYVLAHPDAQYRKDPVRYLRNRAWEDEALSITTPPAERPSDDAMAELAAETARLRAAGQIK
jgi:hypothetical protein